MSSVSRRYSISRKDNGTLNKVLEETFPYFIDQVNPSNGLIADKSKKGSPASIAAIGFAISCYVIAVERGLMSRKEAIKRILTVLRFFYHSKQGRGKDATGYKGFYYHFIHMDTGLRAMRSEVSTMDTALLIAGALSAACYFTRNNKEEREIRSLADKLYRRVDWSWAMRKHGVLTHGWKPGSGFLRQHWDEDYSEAHILYVLALGSPTHPIAKDCYKAWTDTFDWIKAYDIELTYCGPLFVHQFSQLWIDMKGINDSYCKQKGIDYFENSRRATFVHQQYAIDNPNQYKHYHELSWGLTASDGPGPSHRKIDGIDRVFWDYKARGAPYGPDDGTLSPWAVVASLPFAPEIVIPAMNYDIDRLKLETDKYGFNASFNATFPEKNKNPHGWVSRYRFGINEGPIVMMIDNFQNGLLWKIMKRSKHIVKGLKRAGFSGGWLGER